MNKIDLIIDALEGYFDNRPLGLDKMHQALAAARELQQELAKPEQEAVCDKDPSLCGFVQCQLGKACKNTPINTMPTKIFAPNLEQILNAAGFYRREWVGLTDEDIKGILDCDRGWMVDIKKTEQILKDKNT